MVSRAETSLPCSSSPSRPVPLSAVCQAVSVSPPVFSPSAKTTRLEEERRDAFCSYGAVAGDDLDSEKTGDAVDTCELKLDSSDSLWLDHESSDPATRWKMASVPEYTRQLPGSSGGRFMMFNMYGSADGRRFNLLQNSSGYVFDRSTIFFNPLRNKWVYSIKCEPPSSSGQWLGRSRCYWEGDDWLKGAMGWGPMSDLLNWTVTDQRDPLPLCGAKYRANIYNIDAIACEKTPLLRAGNAPPLNPPFAADRRVADGGTLQLDYRRGVRKARGSRHRLRRVF